jgi:hypothetical protein
MPASLDDILTTQKNGVVAINENSNAIKFLAGTNNSTEIAAATTQTIKIGSGWLATVCLINAGSTTTFFYDTNNPSDLTGNRIYALPSTATLGAYSIQVPFSSGLVVVTGTAAIISVAYS